MKRLMMCMGLFLVLWAHSYEEVFSAEVSSQSSQLINYQGYLTDKKGVGLETKPYNLTFWIYDKSSLGTELWGPQTFNKVPVVNGHYNVILGPYDDKKRLLTRAFASNKTYLSIAVTVGDETPVPITPRQQILSAPYATNAMNGVPPGTIMSSMLNETEFASVTGDAEISEVSKRVWTLADGKDVTGSLYASIKNANRVPDLRGMFLRGINVGRSDNYKDPDGERTSGNIQGYKTARPKNANFMGTADTNGVHHHTVMGATNIGRGDGSWDTGDDTQQTTSEDGAHIHGVTITSGGDNETRPINAAVYYYIKIN